MKTENLRRHRGCHLVDTCVSNIPGHRVNFTFGSAGNIGETGIIGHNKLGGVTSKHKFRYASVKPEAAVNRNALCHSGRNLCAAWLHAST